MSRARCSQYGRLAAVPALRRQEERQRLAIELREALKIDGVDAALTEFTLGDKGLRSPERLGHLYLRQSRLPSGLAKAS